MLDLSKLNAKEKEEALALLKKLGVDVTKSSSSQPKKAIPKLTPYVNCYKNQCQTCNGTIKEYYHMTQPEGCDFLKGTLVEATKVDMSLEIKIHEKKVTSCGKCYENLAELDKKDLIRLLIKEKLKWI